MQFNRDLRLGKRGVCWLHGTLALLAVLALMVMRNVPPQFSGTPAASASVSSVTVHQQRPRFNCDTFKWTVPARSFAMLLPSGESADLAPNSLRFQTLQRKGFHYNRPPPAA